MSPPASASNKESKEQPCKRQKTATLGGNATASQQARQQGQVQPLQVGQGLPASKATLRSNQSNTCNGTQDKEQLQDKGSNSVSDRNSAKQLDGAAERLQEESAVESLPEVFVTESGFGDEFTFGFYKNGDEEFCGSGGGQLQVQLQQQVQQQHLHQQPQQQPSSSPKAGVQHSLDMEDLPFESMSEDEGPQAWEEPWDLPPEELNQGTEVHPSAASSNDPAGSKVRRRITGKTKASNTAYAHMKPLGNKERARGRKRKIADMSNRNKAIRVSEGLEARRFLCKHSGLLNESTVHEGDCSTVNVNWDFADAIHHSHEIKAVGNVQDAIHCNRCGGWNAGGPLRTLKDPCRSFVTPARAHQHRLLTLGIVPTRGSKIPSHRRW